MGDIELGPAGENRGARDRGGRKAIKRDTMGRIL